MHATKVTSANAWTLTPSSIRCKLHARVKIATSSAARTGPHQHRHSVPEQWKRPNCSVEPPLLEALFWNSLCFHNNKFRLGWIQSFPSTVVRRRTFLRGQKCGVREWEQHHFFFFSPSLILRLDCDWLGTADCVLFFSVPQYLSVNSCVSLCGFRRVRVRQRDIIPS